MKFGEEIMYLEANATASLHGKFLQYGALKQSLLKAKGGSLPARPGCPKEASNPADGRGRFFDVLDLELRQINREFERRAAALLRRQARPPLLARLFACFGLGTGADKEHARTLRERAVQCRQYAAANAAALRKLLKKYDKLHATDAGELYLQECWAGCDLARGAILHSPLLAEVEALIRVGSPAATPLAHAASSGGRGHGCCGACALSTPSTLSKPSTSSELGSAVGSEWGSSDTLSEGPVGDCSATEADAALQAGEACAGTAVQPDALATGSLAWAAHNSEEDDLQCSICLDVLYKPRGLACGHRFCTPCLLGTLGALGVLAPTDRILARGQAAARAGCPQCRQVGVCCQAVRLHNLDRAARKAFPAEWKAKRSEDKARIRRLEKDIWAVAF